MRHAKVTEEEIAAAMPLFSPEARESARMLIAGEVAPLPPVEWLRYLSARVGRGIADHSLMSAAYIAAGGNLTKLALAARAHRDDPAVDPVLQMYKDYFLGQKPRPPEFEAIDAATRQIVEDLKGLTAP